MITLHLPPSIEEAINEQARQAGLSVESFLLQRISELPSVANFVQNKTLEGFQGDPVTIQRTMRDE